MFMGPPAGVRGRGQHWESLGHHQQAGAQELPTERCVGL